MFVEDPSSRVNEAINSLVNRAGKQALPASDLATIQRVEKEFAASPQPRTPREAKSGKGICG